MPFANALEAIERGIRIELALDTEFMLYAAAAARLYGVEINWLLDGDNELAILRSRVDRVAKRVGSRRPAKTAAA